MDIQLLRWAEAEEIAMPLRIEVFVREQSVPLDLELDEYDPVALHAILKVDDQIIGTGRVFQKDPSINAYFIGRLCVLKKYRGAGFGEALMKAMIHYAQEKGSVECCIHAQTISQSFYKKLGFVAQSETFMEAGIEHVLMTLTMPQ